MQYILYFGGDLIGSVCKCSDFIATRNLIPAYVIVLEIKRDMATYSVDDEEICQHIYTSSILEIFLMQLFNGSFQNLKRKHNEWAICCCFALFSTVVHVVSLKSEIYQQLRLTLTWYCS